MVDIGLVRMLVDDLIMGMHMRVLAGRRERRVVSRVSVVVVKVVMAVAVLVNDRRVPVGMGMLLRDQQPGTKRHDGQRDIEGPRGEFREEKEREDDAEERGDRKE